MPAADGIAEDGAMILPHGAIAVGDAIRVADAEEEHEVAVKVFYYI